jgi:hypothetical protein
MGIGKAAVILLIEKPDSRLSSPKPGFTVFPVLSTDNDVDVAEGLFGLE